MAKCNAYNAKGEPCKAPAVKGSDYCWFHGGGSSQPRRMSLDLSKGVVSRKDGLSYEQIFGRKKLGEYPPKDKLLKFEAYYRTGGLIARAIDSYVAVAVANSYQLVDSKTGGTDTELTKLIEQLDDRIDFHETFEKIFRSCLIFGFLWAEIDIKGKKIVKMVFYPPYEMELTRDKKGYIKEIRQKRGGKTLATWKGESLKDILLINRNIIHSEAFGQGLIEQVYEDALNRDDVGDSIDAVTKFVAYPFRVVKVGNDDYPASENAVTKVADQVEELLPGDWMVTRHNIEFQFEAPQAPPALATSYKEMTRDLIVSLGVPSLYTALEDIDANTLKEIRTIFNSTIRSMQQTVASVFQKNIFGRQIELAGKGQAKVTVPVRLAWNPLTVSVLSILELTQLSEAGIIGISEARRIIQSMGYGLLRGEQFKEEIREKEAEAFKREQERAKLLKPKVSHPTDKDPDKPPIKPPQKDGETPKTKKKETQPTIKKPQPNSPKMTYEEWLKGITVLATIDKFEAWELLKKQLKGGYEIAA